MAVFGPNVFAILIAFSSSIIEWQSIVVD